MSIEVSNGPAPAKRPRRATDLAAIFKALGDPTRLAIYELVRRCGPEGCTDDEAAGSLSQIAARFDLSLSTVSHHVKELRAVGLIHCVKRGQRLFCSVDPDVLEEIESFLGRSER